MFCFVPVFAWMSRRDFAWQAELFFMLASGRRQFKRGYSCFSFRLYFTIYFIFGMRVQTRNVLKLACQPLFQIGNKHSFLFSVMSVDVKHCRHVEHCFLVSREAQSAKHSSDVEFVASSVMFACLMSMDTCGQGWTAFHILCNLFG